ncbi:probable inactive receptor kinase At5g58300 [Cynara cardunculus var. scolymus]|uniref:probable inactive receptor kinase At5g58300 n=1 Tax=Cynara cardunculus var. scolymus TaxID=59895 RepID=UPI000D625E79|nr:probable inactive receptor kinase At5g58300 [Cynara cardunculus var. scolymus]
MLSRALNTKPRRSIRYTEGSCRPSLSLSEYDEIFLGCMENEVVVPCDGTVAEEDGGVRWRLKDVMGASVGVVGESALGVTEKVVFSNGMCSVLKRFRMVCVRRREFGRRVGVLAAVGQRCDYLVSMKAYLYSKRFKFVVCDYYPMGSLYDLLIGAREHGHTPLSWKHRLKIILHIARAIGFIHSQSPARNRNMIMNVHGNLTTSNIMVDVDFNAYLSNYGFTQLAVEVPDTGQRKPPSPPSPLPFSCEPLSQNNDIYHFGIIILDILGGSKALESIECGSERKDEIKVKGYATFEFPFEGKDKRKVWKGKDRSDWQYKDDNEPKIISYRLE